MLRLQPFRIVFPEDLAEASDLLQLHGDKARICAGGTDLVPNMKHELHEPEVVVHLSRIPGLSGISFDGEWLTIGAMTKLQELVDSALVSAQCPSLSEAAAHVAGPQLRNMGTLGGNLCLDTRCLYYNQSYFWREAIGFCLKKSGDTCHVTQTGKRCVAAASNDTATALLALDAEVEICGPAGVRSLSLDAFYVANGEKNTRLEPGEILTRIRVPKVAKGLKRVEAFQKLRNREAIDFPMLSIATRFDLDEAGVICLGRVVVNALAAKPKVIALPHLQGQVFSSALAKEVGVFVKQKCIPLTNICDDPDWRRDMVAVYVERAVNASF